MSLRKPVVVNGIEIPRRRFTGWAMLYFIFYVCIPVIGLGLVLDIVFYFVFSEWFDTCYALLCLFD